MLPRMSLRGNCFSAALSLPRCVTVHGLSLERCFPLKPQKRIELAVGNVFNQHANRQLFVSLMLG